MLFPVPQGSDTGLIYKAARTLLRLTQDDIAMRTGLSSSTISRIENGRRAVTPAVAEKLAGALRPR